MIVSGLIRVFAVGTIPLAVWATADFAAGGTVSWSAIGMLALLGIVVYVPAYLLQHRILLARGPSYSALLGLFLVIRRTLESAKHTTMTARPLST